MQSCSCGRTVGGQLLPTEGQGCWEGAGFKSPWKYCSAGLIQRIPFSFHSGAITMAGPGGWDGGTLQHPRFTSARGVRLECRPLDRSVRAVDGASLCLERPGGSAHVTDGEMMGRARVAWWEVCPQPGAPPPPRRCLCSASPSLPFPPPFSGCPGSPPHAVCQ